MRTGSVVFALVSLGLLSRAVLAEYPVISTIALSGPGHAWSGQPAFDAGSETPFGASLSYPFAWPVLDQHNNVFFYGAHTDGSIDLYGLVGGVATKIDGAGTFPPSAPIAASGGYVAYSYQVGADQSIRAGTLSGGVTEIAQIGGGGAQFSSFYSPPLLSSSGTVVFTATDNSSNLGLYVHSLNPGGTTTLVASPTTDFIVGGQPADSPGLMTVNSHNVILVQAQGAGGSGIWQVNPSGGPGNVIHAVATTDTLLDGGTNQFSSFSNPTALFGSTASINNAGKLAFWASTANGYEGIWSAQSSNPSALTLVAQSAAPTGTQFDGFGTPEVNAKGDIVFSAQLTHGAGVDGSNDEGLWKSTGAGLVRVVSEGDALTGSLSGFTLGNSGSPEFGSYAANSLGEIAFMANLLNAGDPSQDGEALLVWDSVTGLRLVARVGGLLNNDPNRLVMDLSLPLPSGGQDGFYPVFNDNNVLAFLATTQDIHGNISSGVYLASVPEAGTLGLLALGAMGLLRRRK